MTIHVRDSVKIGPERAEHRGDIRKLLIAAFGAAVEADLVDDLHANGHMISSLVASDSDGVAGIVSFCDAQVDIDGCSVAGAALAPLAVRDDVRQSGLGARLVRDGLEACRTAGARFVVVLGDAAYYGRFGFLAAAAQNLRSPFAGPHLQVLELQPGALGNGHGRLIYPPPFDRFL